MARAKSLKVPRLAGSKEVADLIGISRVNVPNARKTKGFPEPIQILASGPVWIEKEIVDYIESRMKKKANRKGES